MKQAQAEGSFAFILLMSHLDLEFVLKCRFEVRTGRDAMFRLSQDVSVQRFVLSNEHLLKSLHPGIAVATQCASSHCHSVSLLYPQLQASNSRCISRVQTPNCGRKNRLINNERDEIKTSGCGGPFLSLSLGFILWFAVPPPPTPQEDCGLSRCFSSLFPESISAHPL